MSKTLLYTAVTAALAMVSSSFGVNESRTMEVINTPIKHLIYHNIPIPDLSGNKNKLN